MQAVRQTGAAPGRTRCCQWSRRHCMAARIRPGQPDMHHRKCCGSETGSVLDSRPCCSKEPGAHLVQSYALDDLLLQSCLCLHHANQLPELAHCSPQRWTESVCCAGEQAPKEHTAYALHFPQDGASMLVMQNEVGGSFGRPHGGKAPVVMLFSSGGISDRFTAGVALLPEARTSFR